MSVWPENERQGQTGLILIFALLVRIAGAAGCIRTHKENLSDAFSRVNLGRQGSGIADLDGDPSPPFRLQGRHIHDDAAPGVSRFADTNGDNVAGYLQIFHRFRQREAVWRDETEVAVD